MRNSQANSILEQANKTVGNILSSFQINNSILDLNDPWSGILSSFIFAIQSMFYTTMQAILMNLVFGCDDIMNIMFDANWHLIKTQKQVQINKNSSKEYSKHVPHGYTNNN